MPASGELIRMMNYADDMMTTLRRIVASIPFMNEEEKKRLAEYLREQIPDIKDIEFGA